MLIYSKLVATAEWEPTAPIKSRDSPFTTEHERHCWAPLEMNFQDIQFNQNICDAIVKSDRFAPNCLPSSNKVVIKIIKIRASNQPRLLRPAGELRPWLAGY